MGRVAVRAGLLLAALAAVVSVAACSSGSGSHAGSPSSSSDRPPQRFDTVTGTLSIKGMDGIRLTRIGQLRNGLPCHTTDGYSDIHAGAQVVISSDTGRTLTIAGLRSGRFNAALQCSFPFHARVPAGMGFYGVEVAGRGVVKEPEGGLGDVVLTLG